LASGEKFEIWAGGTVFDELVLLVGFAGVFAFSGAEDVDLASAGLEGAHGAADAEEQDFGGVAEVEADAAAMSGHLRHYRYLIRHAMA
jgi:hypothetical protein